MFPTENVILPEAFSSRRSDLIFCLSFSGVDDEITHLPEAFKRRQWEKINSLRLSVNPNQKNTLSPPPLGS